MRGIAAVCALLVACGSPGPQATPANQRVAPRGTAPAVSFALATFTTKGLPAVAADGRLVVAALSDSDGGRGFPNLRIEVRDRGDRLVDTIPVMIANDYERLVPDGQEPGPELRTAITGVNARLAALHAEHDLVVMQPIAPTDPLRATANLYPAPSGKRCAQCEPCENPARLAAAYQAPGIETIVVQITYAGTDTCWEPGDQLHVLR